MILKTSSYSARWCVGSLQSDELPIRQQRHGNNNSYTVMEYQSKFKKLNFMELFYQLKLMKIELFYGKNHGPKTVPSSKLLRTFVFHIINHYSKSCIKSNFILIQKDFSNILLRRQLSPGQLHSVSVRNHRHSQHLQLGRRKRTGKSKTNNLH